MNEQKQFILDFKSTYLLIIELQYSNDEMFEFFSNKMEIVSRFYDRGKLGYAIAGLNIVKRNIVERFEIFDEEPVFIENSISLN